MESYEEQSIKRKRKPQDFMINEQISKKVRYNVSQDLYKRAHLENTNQTKESIQHFLTNISSDDQQTSESKFKSSFELSAHNENELTDSVIWQGTIQYIARYRASDDDDEEIDVVNIDECSKSFNYSLELGTKTPIMKNKRCSNPSHVPITKNKTFKSALTLPEGMQKLFAPVSKQSTNSSTLVEISNKSELKSIENLLDIRVQREKIIIHSDNLNNHDFMCKENKSGITLHNRDLSENNKSSLSKSSNGYELTKLHTAKVIIDRTAVNNYFESKQLDNRTKLIDKTNLKLKSHKSLKQTTMLHFYNAKSVKETIVSSPLTNIIKKTVNTQNEAVDANKNAMHSSAETFDSLDMNISKSPKDLKFFYCNDCKYKTNKGKSRILQHILNNHSNGFNNSITKCYQCGKEFKQPSRLKVHQATCGLIPHLMCPYCSLRTKYDGAMKKHLLRLHKKDFEENQLNDIFMKIASQGKAFKAKARKLALEGKEIPKLKEQKRNTLENKIGFYCVNCNDSFDREYNKKKNGLKNCPSCDKLLQFQCLKCKKLLNSYAVCWSHIKYICEQKKTLQCNDCSYVSYTKHKLIMHIERKHTNINPADYVKCPNCDKGFKTRAYMMYHKKACGKAKDYWCPFCSYQTKYIYQFNKHSKQHTKHSKNKYIGSNNSNNNNNDNNDNSKINRSLQLENSLMGSASISKIKDKEHKIVQVISPDSIKEESLRQKTSNGLKLAEYICIKCKATDLSTTVNSINCSKCQIKMHYNCKSCNRQYRKWGSFYQHLAQKCAMPLNYQCEHCDRQFTIKDNLRRHIFAEHMTEVDSNGYVKCPNCKNKYKGRQNMLKHKRRCGETIHYLKCKFCNVKSIYKHNLKKHMIKQHGNLSYTEIENTLNDIAQKVNDKKKESKKNQKLKVENVKTSRKHLELIPKFQNGIQIISHKMNKLEIMNTRHLIEVKCLNCSNSYTLDKKKKNYLVQRCFYCQTNNIYKCVKCFKKYSKGSLIRKHIKREHLLDPNQCMLQECSNCGKRFTFYEDLKNHWHLCFNPSKLTCDYCGFATKFKNSLILHIRRKHLHTSIKKNYECVKCTFKFYEEEQLKKHVKNCNGVYKCDECGAKFRSKIKLINHIQSKQVD